MVRELLLGDNPFVGISHLAQEKAREEVAENMLENKVRVIEAATNGGATGFTFSTHESNLELLSYLSACRKDLLNALDYYILAPYAQAYVRKTNVEGTPSFLMSTLSSLIQKPSAVSSVLMSLISMKPQMLVGPLVEIELDPYLRILPRKRTKAILLHEVATELAVAFDLGYMIKSLASYVRDKIGVGFGLETRNLGQLHRWMIVNDYSPDYVMTPVNPLGYQMAPSKESAEKSVKELGQKTRIIAINVLASGAVDLATAIGYLAANKNYLYAVTSASAKPDRIFQNFSILSKAFAVS